MTVLLILVSLVVIGGLLYLFNKVEQDHMVGRSPTSLRQPGLAGRKEQR